ncbi:hypothetical protein ATERTT37_006976 [Aspergillus terreus]
MADAGKLSFTKRLSLFTPTVFFLTIYLSLATLNFGYDVGSFAGVQALTPFAERFGHYDRTSETWALPSYLASLMNSLPFIGKLIGALTCGPIAEKYGRRVAVAVMACISLMLRNKEADDPMLSEEIRNLQHDHSNESKGRWKELFDDANRTRTWIAILVMFFQQITGQAFVSQYSVSFYKSQKIGDPFLLNVLQNIVSMICNMITFTYVDSLGRRPLLLVGSFLMASFLIALGGLATTPHPSESQKNAMAASMMIAFGFYGLSWAPISYIVLGEVSNSRVKEKTSNLAVSISVITTFIVSFTVPYLINAPYANLGGKVGFLYGGITFVSVAVAYFYVPELKGLSLEEVDRLFATGRPVRHLSGRMLTLAHDDDTAMNKP